ncbi:GFA family protein [Myxococcus sp. RHSTA-1-4]|uniref:GFA family protein n=1 Tax=Myxococcus sp. RHSTA-1-4 TaxID=2874601 RepID=UPI001CBAD588|nr:GFA family protein [Myxococcus sp. RHSTA-1-4]MBZ4419501.1 GFA family protein [Myxococcus sp. RHSTA-1-4]
MTTTIGCLCGAVKLELSGAAMAHLYCHCDDCQRVHGAAYLPAVMYRASQVRLVAGEPVLWKLKTTARATCRECGTRLYAEPPGLGVRSVTATLLPEGMFQPTFHMQCQHALLPVRDGLPHYKGYPKMFGGSDDVMPW